MGSYNSKKSHIGSKKSEENTSQQDVITTYNSKIIKYESKINKYSKKMKIINQKWIEKFNTFPKIKVTGEGNIFNLGIYQTIDFNDKTLIISNQYEKCKVQVIFPFKNKEESFRLSGYDIKQNLNLIDKDILVKINKFENGENIYLYQFFSLRSCITDPKFYHYYTLKYVGSRNGIEFIIIPIVNLRRNKFEKLVPVAVHLWKNFPDCPSTQDDQFELEKYNMHPDRNIENFNYDASILFSNISTYICKYTINKDSVNPPSYNVEE